MGISSKKRKIMVTNKNAKNTIIDIRVDGNTPAEVPQRLRKATGMTVSIANQDRYIYFVSK